MADKLTEMTEYLSIFREYDKQRDEHDEEKRALEEDLEGDRQHQLNDLMQEERALRRRLKAAGPMMSHL